MFLFTDKPSTEAPQNEAHFLFPSLPEGVLTDYIINMNSSSVKLTRWCNILLLA